MLQIVPVTADLVVEGRDDARAVGRFRGKVIAIAIDDGDAEAGAPPATTWLLVADDDKPAPVWVAHGDVTGQRLGR
jgi:hypothetical protein